MFLIVYLEYEICYLACNMLELDVCADLHKSSQP